MYETPDKLIADPHNEGSKTERKQRNGEIGKTLQNKFGLQHHWKSPTKTLLPHIRHSVDESFNPRYNYPNESISNSASKQMGGFMNQQHNQSIVTTGQDQEYNPHHTHFSLEEKQSKMKFLKEQALLQAGTTSFEQPIYTFSEDQEPMDMHKKLQVRLFKRSEKRREQDRQFKLQHKKFLGGQGSQDNKSSTLNSAKQSVSTNYHDPKTNLIKEVVITEENGKLQYKPKNPQNSLRFMHAANYEMQKIETEFRQLAQVEKNRIFLKFVEMNEQPHKYTHYQHFKEGKQRKVQLNLTQHDLESFYIQDLNRKTLTAEQNTKLLENDSLLQHQDTLNLTQASITSNPYRMSAPIIEEEYYPQSPNMHEVRQQLKKISQQIALLQTQREHIGNDKRKNRDILKQIDTLLKERDTLFHGHQTGAGGGTSRDMPTLGSTEVILNQLKSQYSMPKHQLSLETMDLFQDSKQALQKQISINNLDESPTFDSGGKKKQIFWNLMLTGTVADGANPKDAVPYVRQTPPLQEEILSPRQKMQMTNSSINRSINRGNNTQQYPQLSVISPRIQQTLDKIKDPMLKIKRCVERFGRDMIEVVKQEQDYSKTVDEECQVKKIAILQSSTETLKSIQGPKAIILNDQDDSFLDDNSPKKQDLASSSSPVKKFVSDMSLESNKLRNHGQRRILSIEDKIEKSTRNIDEALKKLDVIQEFKVADWMTVKEFNQKVQALNFMKKRQKYLNLGEPQI